MYPSLHSFTMPQSGTTSCLGSLSSRSVMTKPLLRRLSGLTWTTWQVRASLPSEAKPSIPQSLSSLGVYIQYLKTDNLNFDHTRSMCIMSYEATLLTTHSVFSGLCWYTMLQSWKNQDRNHNAGRCTVSCQSVSSCLYLYTTMP